jgi:hypothetical protein
MTVLVRAAVGMGVGQGAMAVEVAAKVLIGGRGLHRDERTRHPQWPGVASPFAR